MHSNHCSHWVKPHSPNIWRVLFPTGFPLLGRPKKHSTSVPFSSEAAVPDSVEEKEVAFVPWPNPDPALAIKTLPGPHVGVPGELCARRHELLPPTLQVVCPFLSPVTVHLKVKLSPGQVGGGAVNCAATTPGDKIQQLPLIITHM